MKLRPFKLQEKNYFFQPRSVSRYTAFTIFVMNSFEQKNIKKKIIIIIREKEIFLQVYAQVVISVERSIKKKGKRKSLIFMPCHVQPRERMKSIQAEI